MSVGVFDNRGTLMKEIKRIKISKKRQITIPQKFYEKLNIGDEVECTLSDSGIIIRPVRTETEFAEEILKDLVEKGYEGIELVEQFKKTRARIRPAVERILDEAHLVAKNHKDSDDEMNEIFGD